MRIRLVDRLWQLQLAELAQCTVVHQMLHQRVLRQEPQQRRLRVAPDAV